MRVIARPIPLEARQLTWETWQSVTDWCHGRFHQGIRLGRGGGGNAYLEVRDDDDFVNPPMVAQIGDWIIYGAEFPAGERWHVATEQQFAMNFMPFTGQIEQAHPIIRL